MRTARSKKQRIDSICRLLQFIDPDSTERPGDSVSLTTLQNLLGTASYNAPGSCWRFFIVCLFFEHDYHHTPSAADHKRIRFITGARIILGEVQVQNSALLTTKYVITGRGLLSQRYRMIHRSIHWTIEYTAEKCTAYSVDYCAYCNKQYIPYSTQYIFLQQNLSSRVRIFSISDIVAVEMITCEHHFAPRGARKYAIVRYRV